MSALSDVLPEPENGTTVVVFGPMICGHLLLRRDDELARERGFTGLERWFNLDLSRTREPLSWAKYTTFGTQVYALGPLLADVEAP